MRLSARRTIRRENQRANEASLAWPSAILALLFGFAFGIPFHPESPIYLGELIGLPLCVGLIITGRLNLLVRRIGMQTILIAMPVMFLGYLVSDLVAGTEMDFMVKALARVTFQFIDIIAVVWFISKSINRIDWLLLGFAISTYIFGYLNPETATWKLSGAVQLTIVAAFFSNRLPRSFGSALLIAAGVVDLLLDCRSPAAIAAIAGAIYFVGMSSKYVKNVGLVPIVLVLAIVGGALNIAWDFASSKDLERQRDSSVGRSAELRVVLGACLRSPFIGYGSNYASSDLIDELIQRTVDGRPRTGREVAVLSFKGHSGLVQSWFEGGILGTALFVVMLIWAAKALGRATSEQQIALADPLLIAAVLLCSWNLLMSPFSGIHRAGNAICFGAVVALRMKHNARGISAFHCSATARGVMRQPAIHI